MPSFQTVDSQTSSPDETIARFLRSCTEHRIAYEQAGVSGHIVWRQWGNNGPPVLLLHGGTGSWLHWIRTIPALSERYRVFALDIPGMGDSSMPGIVEPVQDLTRVLAELVSESWATFATDLGPAHVVGFSFGSMVGAHAAARMGSVASVTLVGASGLRLPFPGPGALMKPSPGMSKMDISEMHRFNMLEIMFSDPRNADDLALEMQLRNADRMRIRTHTSAKTDILIEALPNIPLTPNVVWGAEDKFLPELDAAADRIRSYHAEAKMLTIPEAGHWVAYEQAKAFNHLLLELLKHPQPTPQR